MNGHERLTTQLTLGRRALEIEAQVGEGATSRVYRVKETLSGRLLALKVGLTDAARPLLAAEAELGLRVESATLPGVVGAGTLPPSVGPSGAGLPFLLLEWSEGIALRPLDLDDEDREELALVVARDVGDALEELHSAGFVHGDVKPANVVVDSRSARRARLVDLGLGQSARETEIPGATPRYLAPEWGTGEPAGDGRARDLFALGLTLAEIAAGKVAAAEAPAEAARATRFPSRVAPMVEALLERAPGARPSAEWVRQFARAALGEEETEAERSVRRSGAVKRAYLAARREDLSRAIRGSRLSVAFTGTAADWLSDAIGRASEIAALQGIPEAGEVQDLPPLDALGLRRFLVGLIGSVAARFPVPEEGQDSALADRLLARARSRDPRSFSISDIAGEGPAIAANRESHEPLELGLSLAGPRPSPGVLDAAEWLVSHRPEGRSLAALLGRALRLRGELGRALVVLARIDMPEARVEAAECARRAGDPDRALALLSLVGEGAPMAAGSRAAAIRGRIALDRGDAAQALELTRGIAEAPLLLEVRALAELSLGRLDAARRCAERGLSLSETDEERARAEAVRGNLAHAEGHASLALDAFRRAAEHAARAAAVLEEATYLTGIAASAFEAGELGEALEAATRATLLFEHLGRPSDSARAHLARAAALAALGSDVLAREAAQSAITKARNAGDARCGAFCHLVLSDVAASQGSEGLEHARQARGLVRDGTEDALRADARRLRFGDGIDTTSGDALADDRAVQVPARLEWWGARAACLEREGRSDGASLVLAALGALVSQGGPVSSRGEAFSAGAALAARAGSGDIARRLAIAATDAARRLAEGAPPELRPTVLGRPWVRSVAPAQAPGILPEQIAEVEAVVRALGSRDRLRPLLDQVLDALVLWTGVERGLLLLRVGDRLVPRAARNIARDDLRGAQLALSRSLADRALASLEPVVAVDAAGELPELHASVHALKLRSVLAVPLVARGEALGVVYLDDRMRRGAFGPGELAWVRLLAALAAIAIADARDQLTLRRAARRAARAEGRLALALALREAELDVARRELAVTRDGRVTRFRYDAVIGDSEPIRALLTLLDRVTPTEVPVLVTGESGSGKELVARAIHDNGPRAAQPFVGENCGAIPEGLLESTLFGHVRGAFTGASRPHSGLFEVASGGTLFLDEIGEMPPSMQTKLLRVLEDGEVRPVGSERARRVDVRIIAATHRDLAAMVQKGTFREDLYYRLNVIHIVVPALRDRRSDIEAIARHLVEKHAVGRSVRLSRGALDALTSFPWPGNVRQLENELRRALVLTDDVIRPEHLSDAVRSGGLAEASRPGGLNVRQRVDALEVDLVTAALGRTSGNQTRAAELLGLSRFGLQKMIRRLGIRIPSSPALQERAGAVTGDG